MSRPILIPIWKKAPFSRLLLPLITGILLQWYLQISLVNIAIALVAFTAAFLLFLGFPMALRFKLQAVQGLVIQLMLLALGALITWQQDIRHQKSWYGNFYNDSCYLVVRIDEPLVEKTRSFKADAYAESIIANGQAIPCKGKLLLYFAKDSFKKELRYGDRIVIHKTLQVIKNSGNPGAFNYQRYAAFQGLFHNVYLKQNDWIVLRGNGGSNFRQFIFSARAAILAALQNSLHNKDELGIAEALLIGYTNDLDKDLVQAYSNTGVVHIIAISGMHLGLIYVLLIWIFAKIPFLNRSKILQLVLIMICLWLFSILTGASASVLRAAVMFSFIAVGKHFFKQASMYNSLAASAFLLLCYNPYYLWSVGFQLSYLAVLGIVIFQRPIYNCFYIKNKWIDKLWQLTCVSTAAQLLTFPVCIYYFHQFPNLFLFSNLIAVPLSGFILYAEILLVAFSWVSIVETWLGKLVSVSVWLMNRTILWINELPFAVWDKIPATVLSTVLLYAIIIFSGLWLINKNRHFFKPALYSLLAFFLQHAVSSWIFAHQQKLLVYHVPRYQAIDMVDGHNYMFIGDSVLLEDAVLQNFHLKPGRIAQQLNYRADSLAVVFKNGGFYQFNNKKILIIDRPIMINPTSQKMQLDLIIISGNPRVDITELAGLFSCKQFVFDGSNPAWKIERWTAQCNSLGINFHATAVTGAFIYDIGI